jgi:hypothetical protein
VIADGYELQLTVWLSADSQEDLAKLLREVAKQVKKGKIQGDASYCMGMYEFDTQPNIELLSAKS